MGEWNSGDDREWEMMDNGEWNSGGGDRQWGMAALGDDRQWGIVDRREWDNVGW